MVCYELYFVMKTLSEIIQWKWAHIDNWLVCETKFYPWNTLPVEKNKHLGIFLNWNFNPDFIVIMLKQLPGPYLGAPSYMVIGEPVK